MKTIEEFRSPLNEIVLLKIRFCEKFSANQKFPKEFRQKGIHCKKECIASCKHKHFTAKIA